jgi:hypothetical protein
MWWAVWGFVAATWCAQASAGSVSLGWTPPANTGEIAGYQVHYGLAARQYASMVDVAGPRADTARVDGLATGTRYYFAVRARDATSARVSAWSNEVVTALPTPPQAPDGLSAAVRR